MNAARRIGWTVLATVLTIVAGAGLAYADEPDPAQTTLDVEMTDTHGVSVWDFDLAINNGNPANPGDLFMGISAFIAQMLWETYRVLVVIAIYILDWVLAMGWIEWILTPMRGLYNIVGIAMDTIGLMPLMLLILGLVFGYWMLKGRYAGGITELMIGCTIAALATGVLADPMDLLDGEDGLIIASRDAGFDLATGINTDGESFENDNGESLNAVVGAAVDTMLRGPHQVLNYGSVIDGTDCEEVYDENVGAADARAKIRDCNPSYREVADHPTPFTVIMAYSMLYALIPFLFLTYGVAILLFLAVLLLVWTAVQLLWQLLLGIVNGDARAGLFKSFANLGFGCVMVAFASVFVVAWMKVMFAFFDASADATIPFVLRIHIFNLMMTIGVIAMFLIRHKIKKALRRLAQRMAALGPGNAPTPAPSRVPAVTKRAAQLGWQAWLHHQPRQKPPRPPRPIKEPRPALEPTPTPTYQPQLGPGARRPQLPPGPGGGAPPANSPKAPPGDGGPNTPANPGGGVSPSRSGAGIGAPGGADVLRKRLATAGKITVMAASAIASSGSSLVVDGGKAALMVGRAGQAIKVAQTAQRAGAAARSARPGRDQSARDRLATAQQVHMRSERRRVVDEDTGTRYRSSTVASNGQRVEVLRPEPVARSKQRAQTPSSQRADALRDRLRRR